MTVHSPPVPLAALIQLRPAGASYSPCVNIGQAPQAPVLGPPVEVPIEVFDNLPLWEELQGITSLLGKRQQTRSRNGTFRPTILELITLVKRNPERPRSGAWESISALTIRYEPTTKTVTVEYCVEHCGFEPRTGEFDPKRRMVLYSAPEESVFSRAQKKLRDLKRSAKP